MTAYTQARTTVDDGYQHAALLEIYDNLAKLVVIEAEGTPGNATGKVHATIYLTQEQLIELVDGINVAIDSMVESDPDVFNVEWKHWTLDEIEKDQARVREEREES